MTISQAARQVGWRTPLVVIVCGCVIAMVSFGPRSSLGFFLTPLSSANGWGREVFAFAVAIQNLLWGVGQPFAGAIADRFGTNRVLIVGSLFYAAGLALMAHSTSPGMLTLSAGVLIGFGLSGCSFNIVLGAFGKLLPESWRSMAFGIGTAAGSFGQFLFSPIAVAIMGPFGWQVALYIFAGVVLLIVPLRNGARDPARSRARRHPERPGAAVAQGRAGGSVRPPQLRAAGARIFHLRLPACLHHRAPAGLSDRPRPCRRRSAAGPWRPSACSTSSARWRPASSAT